MTFSSIVDVESFSLRVNHSDIPRIPEILEASWRGGRKLAGGGQVGLEGGSSHIGSTAVGCRCSRHAAGCAGLPKACRHACFLSFFLSTCFLSFHLHAGCMQAVPQARIREMQASQRKAWRRWVWAGDLLATS